MSENIENINLESEDNKATEQSSILAAGEAANDGPAVSPMLQSAAMMSATPVYNDPKSYLEAPFAYRFSEREHVTLASGTLEYRETDFTLPGRDGFDLSISRVYSSGEAGVYEMTPEPYGSGQMKTGTRDNEHNLMQYGLGLGWRFNLPSIETVAESKRKEGASYSDFLHLDDGRNLELKETDGVLSFKDYTLLDVTIEAATGTLTHPARSALSASYDVVVGYQNGHKDYFKKVMDGESLESYSLTARKDRFGNCIFFELAPYGGMTVTDSWGRDVRLIRTGERLIWTLPPDGDNNPLTVCYETEDDGKRLVSAADRLGRVTRYSYHDQDKYSAVCKYVSASYGDTTDTKFPFVLLSEVEHPSGAQTRFCYGSGKEAVPLKLNVGEYGGCKQHFPILSREDISENDEFQTVEYAYTLDEDGAYIQTASVEKLGGVKEIYTFSDNASKNQLTRHERRHDGVLMSSTAYVYGADAAAANYRLCVSETETVWGDSEASPRLSSEKVTSYVYSADKKGNLISETVSYTGEETLNAKTVYAYGECSILTEKRTRLSPRRYLSERYELDASRDSLVASYKRVYEILNNVTTLREKTGYVYGEDELAYCVVEERRYKDAEGGLESSAEYVSRLFGYEAPYLHRPTSVTLTGLVDVEGKALPDIIERSEYDIFGNPTRRADGCGNDTLYRYDALGRLVLEESPEVNHLRLRKEVFYDDKRNTITTSDANGSHTRVEYSALGLPLWAYLAEGPLPSDDDILAVEYVYDNQCRLTEEIRYDGEGKLAGNALSRTLYRYDAFDRVAVKEMPAVRYYESHRYDEVCALPFDTARLGSLHETTVEGEVGAPDVVTASYANRLGYEEAQYLGGDLRAKATYDLAGNTLSQTDALGNVTSFAVDYAGRAVTVTKPFGEGTASATTVYDTLGNKKSVADFLGNAVNYLYDNAGRVLKVISPFDGNNSSETKNYYDACGRVKRKDVKLGEREWRITSYDFDALGRMTDSYSYTASSLNTWIQRRTVYDGAGNKLSVSSCETGYGIVPSWRTASYSYNRFNKPLTFTDLLGGAESYAYDKVGRLLTKTLRDGTVIAYEYDALGRLTRESAETPLDADETPTIRETAYYRTGQKKEQRLLEKNTAGLFSAMVFSRVTFEPLVSRYLYNAKGQLTEQRDPEGVRKVFTYDALGSRAGFELYRDNSVEPEIELCYTYDSNGRLTQLKRGETALASYSYNANGRKLTQINANGTMSEYAYNAAGLVTRLENKLADGENETILSAWDYAYRLDGIQTSKTDKDGVKTSYTYDMVGRLTKEQTSTESEGAGGETEVTVTGTVAYAYDGCGNRTSASATGFPVYSESYSYDGANRLVSRTRTEDGESVTTVNTYDANGNLIRSQKGEGASAEFTTRSYNGFGQQVSHTTAEREVWFRYRPDGLRHSKRVTTSSGVTAATHLWDGQDIVAEVSTNGTTKAAYLRAGGELVAQVIGDATSYYLHNAHGDVTERVDASGAVLKSYSYDAFGNILNPAVVGNPVIWVDQSPFGYCGEYLDKETGEIYLRARYYDATSGGFASEDPLRDNANWYAYCGADPVNNEDPTGLASWLSKLWSGVKSAVSRAVSAVKRVFTPARTVSRPAARPAASTAARSVVAQAARAAVPRASASPAVAAAVSGAMAGAGYSSGDSVGGNNSAGSILWKNEVSASITSEKVLMDSFLLRLSSTTTVKSVENTSGNPLSPYTVINNSDKNPINSTSGLRIERGLLIAEYVVGMSDISSSLGIKAPDGAYAKIRVGINGVNGSLFIAADTSTAPVENTTTEQSYVLEINGALLAVSVILAAIMYMMGVPVPVASPT